MKKLSAILLISLCLSGITGLAQKGLYIGVGATALSTWVTNMNNYGRPDLDYVKTWGSYENLFVGYDFTSHLGLRIDLGLSRIGQKTKDNIGDTAAYDRRISLYYFNLPVMLKYRTGGAIANFYILVGPQFNFRLKAKQTYNINGTPDHCTVNGVDGSNFKLSQEGVTDHYSSMDVVARLDLGTDIKIIPHLILNVGLTFDYGLMDINASNWRLKDSKGNYNASHNIFGGINFGLAYRF